MRPAGNIKGLIKSLHDTTSAEMDERVLKDILKALGESQRTKSAASEPNIWRIIMRSRISKFVAAAVIIIAVIVSVNHFGGSIDGTSVAWGDVVSHAVKVDYVHFLFTTEPKYHRTVRPYEGWYSNGKVVKRSWQGDMVYDDGNIYQRFDRNNTRTGKGLSEMKGQTFFSWISQGLLEEDNEQFRQQVPTCVGDDFLIYKFDPPEEISSWINSISITVGRNSLLPIQIKTYHKYNYETGEGIDDIKDGCTMLIFDYDASKESAEFFEPPDISEPPHGTGEIVLNGEEAMIDVSSSRDIKTMVMRLYSETSQNNQQPKILADVSFILKDGVRSITCPGISLWVNHARRIGMGDVDNWPDKKYRNISATLVLKPTDKENTYTIEVNCWLDTIRAKEL